MTIKLEWQPMETAPVDVPLLVFTDSEDVCVAMANTYPDGIAWFPVPSEWESSSITPTHWMPLPEPPQ